MHTIAIEEHWNLRFRVVDLVRNGEPEIRAFRDIHGQYIYMAVTRQALSVDADDSHTNMMFISGVRVGIWGLRSNWMIAPLETNPLPPELESILPAHDFPSLQDAIMFFVLNGGKVSFPQTRTFIVNTSAP